MKCRYLPTNEGQAAEFYVLLDSEGIHRLESMKLRLSDLSLLAMYDARADGLQQAWLQAQQQEPEIHYSLQLLKVVFASPRAQHVDYFHRAMARLDIPLTEIEGWI